MRSVIAIAWLSVLSTVRSGFVFALAPGVVLAAIILPLTVSGDGTALGLFQLSMKYAFTAVASLLSLSTVLLTAWAISHDLESEQIVWITAKPVGHGRYWLGRWLGFVCLNGLALICCASLSLLTTFYRIHHTAFVGPDVTSLRPGTYQTHVRHYPVGLPKSGRGQTQPIPDAEPNEDSMRGGQKSPPRFSIVPPGSITQWRFDGIEKPLLGRHLSLRYRGFWSSPGLPDNDPIHAVWRVRDPRSGELYTVGENEFHSGLGALAIPADQVDEDGSLIIELENRSVDSRSLVFDGTEAMVLMCPTAGLISSFSRLLALTLVQIALLAVVGCSAGCFFSTPVALLASGFYVFIGSLIDFMKLLLPRGAEVADTGLLSRFAAVIRLFSDWATISLAELNGIDQFTSGLFVPVSDLAATAAKALIMYGIPMAGFGIWQLYRREIGDDIQR